MRNIGLKAKVRIKKFDYRTKSGSLRYDNLLNRNFSTTNLNQKLGTDITYLLTNGKTYYLSIVKDFHNNEILDYKISASLDMTFVVQNIIQAWVNAQKPNSWILQSDQGFYYTNPSYKTLCDELKIKMAFIPLCTIFKFYHINGDKSLPRKLSPHVFKSNTKLQFQN
ncbi:DDE-type integrase/transposase/recombinase [Spiroplasma endosymbiont of Zeiraphera isertana]|uniref:DDE-type integrase/transposase/recombinase n=1 Tax=Spiroplasma endosymbiont of Zeiraphera isertana TaxID=3066313 RepID=UPI00313DB93F